MKVAAAILYAIALMAALTVAPYAEGKWIIRKVSAGGVTYIVDEDFSETGQPTGNTWTVNAGTINWDSTAHAMGTGEAMYLDGAGEDVEVAVGSGGTFWAAAKMEWDHTNVSNQASLFALRNAANTAGIILQANSTTEGATSYINGAAAHNSSTFQFTNGNIYAVWLRYEPNGTCGVYISTSTTRPTAPTDTATAYAYEATDTANLTITKLSFKSQSPSTPTCWWDDLFVDDAEITNPW